MTDTFGLFGSIFCDFGDEFEVSDVNGEDPMTSLLSSVSAEEVGLVTVYDEGRNGLEDGDYVTFTEVGGTVELNGCEPVPIKVTGPYTVSAHAKSNAQWAIAAPGVHAECVALPRHCRPSGQQQSPAPPPRPAPRHRPSRRSSR